MKSGAVVSVNSIGVTIVSITNVVLPIIILSPGIKLLKSVKFPLTDKDPDCVDIVPTVLKLCTPATISQSVTLTVL